MHEGMENKWTYGPTNGLGSTEKKTTKLFLRLLVHLGKNRGHFEQEITNRCKEDIKLSSGRTNLSVHINTMEFFLNEDVFGRFCTLYKI